MVNLTGEFKIFGNSNFFKNSKNFKLIKFLIQNSKF